MHQPTAPKIPDLRAEGRARLPIMWEAAKEVAECERVVTKGGGNLVSDLLRGSDTFYEWTHYPAGDVYDAETHSQYYYHAHDNQPAEHGHFHVFLRRPGMPAGTAPVPYRGQAKRPLGDDAISHIVGISMGFRGQPLALFAANRWVTGETWYPAAAVISMIDFFRIDHAYPSWPVNRWITAMLRLFRPEVEALLRQRDDVIAAWSERYPGRDILEDTALALTGVAPISIPQRTAELRTLLKV